MRTLAFNFASHHRPRPRGVFSINAHLGATILHELNRWAVQSGLRWTRFVALSHLNRHGILDVAQWVIDRPLILDRKMRIIAPDRMIRRAVAKLIKSGQAFPGWGSALSLMRQKIKSDERQARRRGALQLIPLQALDKGSTHAK